MDFLRDITGVLTGTRPGNTESERKARGKEGGNEKRILPRAARAECLKIRFTWEHQSKILYFRSL